MLRLTDANTGEPHVTSEDIGIYNVAQFGYDSGYFPGALYGEFKIEILSNNKIRVGQGTGIIGGRRFRNVSNLDITLDSGAAGENRIDVILIARDQDSEGIESISLEINKGTPTTGTPSNSVGGSEGPIPDMSIQYVCPWIEVEFQGINIIRAELHKSFPSIKSVYGISNDLKDKIVVGSIKDVKIVTTNQQMTFTDGKATKNLSSIASTYGKNIVAVMAQLVSATTTVILSSTCSNNEVTVTAGKFDGTKYSGSPTVFLLLFLA